MSLPAATLPIQAIPCLTDNLSYLLQWQNKAFIVDVPEAKPVLAALQKSGKPLAGIFITHGHWDHIHGLNDLMRHHNCPVYGMPHDAYPIPALTHPQHQDCTLETHGLIADIKVTPGHMPAHLSYYFPQLQALFSGDVLFSLGCGKVFDGTHKELHDSLQKLICLPPETTLYPGHAYTLSNGKFIASLLSCDALGLPPLPGLDAYLQTVKTAWEKKDWSGTSTLALEKQLNPFLRCEELASALGMQQAPAHKVFKALRTRKDAFTE